MDPKDNKEPIDNSDIHLDIPREVLNCFSFGSNRAMYCDYMVVIDDCEFPCHRFVLNACSGFFEALFRSKMKEQQEMKVTIQGISADTFRLVLDVIYTGTDVLSLETVLDVWKAAHQLQIVFLTSMCEHFITKNVNVHNWYPFYLHAPILATENTIQFLFNYMVDNFLDIGKSDMFRNIQFKDLLDIIKLQPSTVGTDLRIGVIMKWCEATQANCQFLGELIQALDLSKASNECLAGVMTNDLVLSNKMAITAVNKQVAGNLLNLLQIQSTPILEQSCWLLNINLDT